MNALNIQHFSAAANLLVRAKRRNTRDTRYGLKRQGWGGKRIGRETTDKRLTDFALRAAFKPVGRHYCRGCPTGRVRIVYLPTAAHAVHLAGGILVLLCACAIFVLRRVVEQRRIVVEVASWYWHFMGVLWVYIFALLEFGRQGPDWLVHWLVQRHVATKVYGECRGQWLGYPRVTRPVRASHGYALIWCLRTLRPT